MKKRHDWNKHMCRSAANLGGKRFGIQRKMWNCGTHPEVPHGAAGLMGPRKTLKVVFTWMALEMCHELVCYLMSVTKRRERVGRSLTSSLNQHGFITLRSLQSKGRDTNDWQEIAKAHQTG